MVMGKTDKVSGIGKNKETQRVDSLRNALLAGVVRKGISTEPTFGQDSKPWKVCEKNVPGSRTQQV